MNLHRSLHPVEDFCSRAAWVAVDPPAGMPNRKTFDVSAQIDGSHNAVVIPDELQPGEVAAWVNGVSMPAIVHGVLAIFEATLPANATVLLRGA